MGSASTTLSQVALELEALLHGDVHAPFKECVRALAVALGDVHRHVGVPDEIVNGDAVRCGECNSEAGRDRESPPLEAEDAAELFEDALGDLHCIVRVGEVLEEDGEFVAAEASQRVGLPGAASESVGDVDQQSVTRPVAKAVVD